MFHLPWKTSHETAVEFVERNGRIIRVEEDDVLRDGGRADQLLTDAAKMVRIVTDRKGAREIEIYASEFKLFITKGSGIFRLFRRFRKPKVIDGVLIYSKVDGESTNGEFHLVRGGIGREIDKYVESHGLSNK